MEVGLLQKRWSFEESTGEDDVLSWDSGTVVGKPVPRVFSVGMGGSGLLCCCGWKMEFNDVTDFSSYNGRKVFERRRRSSYGESGLLGKNVCVDGYSFCGFV